MSSKKGKNVQTSIRLDAQLLDWLSALRDAQGLPSQAEALRIAIQRAYPNIEEIAEFHRKKSEERNEALGKLLNEDKPDDQ